MSKRFWRSSFLMLIKVNADSKKIVIPLPLPLIEELFDACAWLLYWLIKIKPDLVTIICENMKGLQSIPAEWSNLSEALILELLTAPAIFFRALRAEGPFTLVKINDDSNSIEISLI